VAKAYYNSVQNVLSSLLTSKNTQLKILPVLLYGCELGRINRGCLRTRVLTIISGPNEMEVTGGSKNCIIRNFTICTLHQLLFG
jgi:hypothetical protein